VIGCVGECQMVRLNIRWRCGMHESGKLRGVYSATCVGPKSQVDRMRLTTYLVQYPELLKLWGDRCYIEAAKHLAIELEERWSSEMENVVATVGKNLALDTFLAGATYTVTGPFMGLISSTSFTAVAAADTMASHAGWLEAGGTNAPTYTGNRKTCAWSAASGGSKSLSSAPSYAFTGTGTVKGGFILYGTGAVNTKDDTNGVLYSAGLFGTGDRAVLSGDTVTVSYSTSF
jgi:hypothetical protein